MENSFYPNPGYPMPPQPPEKKGGKGFIAVVIVLAVIIVLLAVLLTYMLVTKQTFSISDIGNRISVSSSKNEKHRYAKDYGGAYSDDYDSEISFAEATTAVAEETTIQETDTEEYEPMTTKYYVPDFTRETPTLPYASDYNPYEMFANNTTEYYVVNTGEFSLYIRTGPGQDFEQIGKLHNLDEISVLGIYEGWAFVEKNFGPDGIFLGSTGSPVRGWVSTDYIINY